MIPAFEHHPNCRFLGFPMSQNRYAIPAWSYLLESVLPHQIVEIGTSKGGMSCLLALAMRRIGGTFDTIDIECCMSEQTQAILSRLCAPSNGFHRHDVFSHDGAALVHERLLRPGLSVLLCDGGNKGKEFSTFAPFMKPGDIIGVHDARGRESWPWQEFDPKLFGNFASEHDLEEFMRDVFLETGWFVCKKKLKS